MQSILRVELYIKGPTTLMITDKGYDLLWIPRLSILGGESHAGNVTCLLLFVLLVGRRGQGKSGATECKCRCKRRDWNGLQECTAIARRPAAPPIRDGGPVFEKPDIRFFKGNQEGNSLSDQLQIIIISQVLWVTWLKQWVLCLRANW